MKQKQMRCTRMMKEECGGFTLVTLGDCTQMAVLKSLTVRRT
uniref:Uncharacterized protein n=1 Tax=Arundo donax TaxID=35708 RepID=A0A0A9EMC1_ARUDO